MIVRPDATGVTRLSRARVAPLGDRRGDAGRRGRVGAGARARSCRMAGPWRCVASTGVGLALALAGAVAAVRVVARARRRRDRRARRSARAAVPKPRDHGGRAAVAHRRRRTGRVARLRSSGAPVRGHSTSRRSSRRGDPSSRWGWRPRCGRSWSRASETRTTSGPSHFRGGRRGRRVDRRHRRHRDAADVRQPPGADAARSVAHRSARRQPHARLRARARQPRRGRDAFVARHARRVGGERVHRRDRRRRRRLHRPRTRGRRRSRRATPDRSLSDPR